MVGVLGSLTLVPKSKILFFVKLIHTVICLIRIYTNNGIHVFNVKLETV